jgi:hypothetical protein
MQLVGVFLLLLSVGLIVGPIGTVIVMNRDDMSQLVTPKNVETMLYGDTIYLINSSNTNCSGYDNCTISIMGIITPQVVNITVNQSAKTFEVVVNITNHMTNNLTLNNLTTTIQTNQDHNTLLTVSLKEPVTIVSNETSAVTVMGYWTKTTEDYLNAYHTGTSIIGIELTNISIEINHLQIKLAGPINVGNIPLILEG